MPVKRKIHLPSIEEDAELTAAALADPDNLPLTDAQLAQFARKPRGRPNKGEERKVLISLRIDPAVLAALQGTGAGWQTRVNEVLRDWAKRNGLLRDDTYK